MSQFCYLTHWNRGKPPPKTPEEVNKSKVVQKLACFLTSTRSIQNVSITNQDIR